jgi:hypothetical protein
MDDNLEAGLLRDMLRNVLDELVGRVEGEPSEADRCAIEVALQKAALRAHDHGIVSATTQLERWFSESGIEEALRALDPERLAEFGISLPIQFNPVVGASAGFADPWLKRYGGGDA